MTFTGQEYVIGDFTVRVGNVIKHVGDVETVAVVVIVAYTASSYATATGPLLDEFQAMLQAQVDQLKGDKLDWRPLSMPIAADAEFGPQHLALSYWGAVTKLGPVKSAAV